MVKKAKEKEPQDNLSKEEAGFLEASKSDVEGYVGGLSVNLDRMLKKSKTEGAISLRDKLSHDLGQWLDQEIKNQEGRIEKIAKWQKMYRGQRPEKSSPYPGCANVAIPITRINSEAIAVRIIEGAWAQPKFWVVKPRPKPEATDQEVQYWETIAAQLEDDMDWWQKYVGLKQKMFSPMMQAIKTGTGIIKLSFVSKKRTITRYAREGEVNDPNIPTFKLAGGGNGIKEVVTEYEGDDVFPISREDWIISSDAISIQDAFLCGFRKYFRKADVTQRVRQRLWDKTEAEKLKLPDELDEIKKSRAEEQGKEIPPHLANKFAIWEIWLRYDVDEDGEEDDIVITFHPDTSTILRCIYNPIFNKFRPFIDFTFNPAEYCFDGEGVCEILEDINIEVDSLHNRRLDRLTQINAPMLFVRRGIGLDNLKLLPGLIQPVDDDPAQVIKEFRFSDTTYSSIADEQMLIDYANKATGVTPDVLGQPTASRPVFREMASRLQEANKKFQFMINHWRRKAGEMGMMHLEINAQYQPTRVYYTENGKRLEAKTVNYPLEFLRDHLHVELAASSEFLNQEVRRQIAMERYGLLQNYYTSLAGMAQLVVSPYAPRALKELFLRVSQRGEKELETILRDMDVTNPDLLVMDLVDGLGNEAVQQALQISGKPPPPDQGGAKGGGQRGGGGPSGPPPGSQGGAR